ncbi:hypothetical protein [Helicobacter sp. 16-1353]|uniref:hypothetical protein n=1 Tax=Helicobacter sp. 16-1353 TaxID=2004996 RepID=UPI0011BEEC09|nr:hypothetical protein [Helicobacter sp. 16-1353]
MQRLQIKHIFYFCMVLVPFLAIVLFNINRESLWGDEAFSVMTIGGGESQMESKSILGDNILRCPSIFI